MAEDAYDYVIVGGGSAGCVLAARLSEDPATRVLLLEAGPSDRNPWLHLPIGYYRTILDPRFSWCYRTEPVPDLHGRQLIWPRGRVLGGSSAINGLVWVRGQQADYDHWRQLGNPGWSFDDVAPYFRKAEARDGGDGNIRGTDGPMPVADPTYVHPLCTAYVAAAVQAGVPRNADYNGAEQEGVGDFQLTIRNGLRWSAAKAYLAPARRRPNLVIETEALAHRVIFDGRRAAGVTYRRAGQMRDASALREVIVAAGAIGSPLLLLRSGIGPADHLGEHGILVRHALTGVGRNLADHFQARTVTRSRQPVTFNDIAKSPLRKVAAGLRWAATRTGPLTVGAGQVVVFARVLPESATPDVQFHVIMFSADKPGRLHHDFSAFTVSVCPLRPTSLGWLGLRDDEPESAPAIHPRYLDGETEQRCVVGGIRLARRIAKQPALAAHADGEFLPGDDCRSDDEILAFARETGGTIYHPSGTCRMGPATDASAVVDARLRVHGFGGLRVVDASIMPTLVSGNTNAPVIMIAEKAADMIRADARAA